MVSYYIDVVTDPTLPRLVRQVNNGAPLAIALGVENLQFTLRPRRRRRPTRPTSRRRRRRTARIRSARPTCSWRRDRSTSTCRRSSSSATRWRPSVGPAQPVVRRSLPVSSGSDEHALMREHAAIRVETTVRGRRDSRDEQARAAGQRDARAGADGRPHGRPHGARHHRHAGAGARQHAHAGVLRRRTPVSRS